MTAKPERGDINEKTVMVYTMSCPCCRWTDRRTDDPQDADHVAGPDTARASFRRDGWRYTVEAGWVCETCIDGCPKEDWIV